MGALSRYELICPGRALRTTLGAVSGLLLKFQQSRAVAWKRCNQIDGLAETERPKLEQFFHHHAGVALVRSNSRKSSALAYPGHTEKALG